MNHGSRRFRFRTVPALMLVSVVALSSAGAQGPNARVSLPGYETPILLDTLGIARPIAGNRDTIFVALTRTFAELDIPVEERDPTTGLLGSHQVQKLRRLGKVPLSRYFDCGRGFSGANADVYRITIALSAWVEPGSGIPKRLHIAIAGSGQDPAGTKTGFVKCNSTGALEAEIAERVQARLAQG